MAPKYVLNYFGLQGRGEIIRLLFHYKEVEFTDNIIAFPDWPALKGDSSRFPLGQMPTLEVDGQVICQSAAIYKYLAEEFGLYGADISERVIINQVLETLNDFLKEYFAVYMNSTLVADEKKEAFVQLFLKPSIISQFAFLENIIKSNSAGSGYFVGSSISLADLAFNSISGLTNQSFLDGYHLLNELNHKVKAAPTLKKYLDERTIPVLF